MVLSEADKLTIYYLAAAGGEAEVLLASVPELTELLKVGPRGPTCRPDKLTTSYMLLPRYSCSCS